MEHPSASTKLKIVEAFKDGNSIAHLTNVFGYHRNSIARWIKNAKSDPRFEKPRKDGSGRPSALSGKIGNRLIRILKEPASNYGFETDFWTTARLQEVCNRILKIRVSRMAIHRSLTRYEHSYKKPEKRYYEASKIKQTLWVQDVLPKIIEIEKTKNAIVYFEDESCVQLTPELGKTWGPVGEVLVQPVTGNRGSVSAISAITKSGNLVFNIHDSGKRFSSQDIVDFLKSLSLHHKNRHLIVIMDQAPCHTSKKVQSFVIKQKKLNVFYLPPRSPDFNPTEKLWNHLKNNELRSHKAKNVKELKELTTRKLSKIAKNKGIVRSVFKRCHNSNLYLN